MSCSSLKQEKSHPDPTHFHLQTEQLWVTQSNIYLNPRAGEVLVAMHGPGGWVASSFVWDNPPSTPQNIRRDAFEGLSFLQRSKLTLSGIKEVHGALRYIATKDRCSPGTTTPWTEGSSSPTPQDTALVMLGIFSIQFNLWPQATGNKPTVSGFCKSSQKHLTGLIFQPKS